MQFMPPIRTAILVFSAVILTCLIPIENVAAQEAAEKPDSLKLFLQHFQTRQFFLLPPKAGQSDPIGIIPPRLSAPALEFRFSTPSLRQLYEMAPLYPELYAPRIERDLSLRASGGQRILLSPLAFSSQFQRSNEWETGKKEFQNEVIPSNLQLKVLTTLWSKNETTEMEIYATLDSSYSIIAENMGSQMVRMMKLGLVERKLISPQNPFSIFMFQIEMSGKNRRNKVYLYRTRVKMAKIVQLLLARLSLVKSGDLGSSSELQRLRKKLGIVLAVHSND